MFFGKSSSLLNQKISTAFFFIISLYLFLFSIQLIGKGFHLFGEGLAEKLIRTTSNPLSGLFIGILSTAIAQSSSLTTSIVVGLVAGGMLSLHNAIPIIMGANIGTTITNIIISLGYIGNRDDFRRAFAASTVHDFFNILTVLILFPLQYFTNYLEWISVALTRLAGSIGGLSFASPLQLLTRPPAELVICLLSYNGIAVLIFSLAMLFVSLSQMVKHMKILIITRAEVVFDSVIFRSPFQGLLFGMVLTALVQSSSVTTSLVVPLAGAGLLKLNRIFPYTMGANIGTTITSILAALALGIQAGISVAFAHTIFNVTGVLIFWKLQFIPIRIAEFLAGVTAKYRWFAFVYVGVIFFALPLSLIYLMK